jgi:hypothetical protein
VCSSACVFSDARVNETEALDRDVRLHTYRRFVDAGSPPPVEETADVLGVPQAEVEDALRRLAEGRAIVLEPGRLDIWMAQPLSTRPTSFRVEVPGRGKWWGVCAWDAPGVAAMLDGDATISTSCPDCGEPLVLAVTDGALGPDEAIAHFAVPAAQWWDDIGFT